MIPFNKIPRGLRVPLFFGELAIDGDVLGGSSQPPQPGISCVGASEKMNFGSFRGYWDMELNGVFYPSSTDLLQNYITNHFSDKIYADYDGFINFGNISHDDHRIRLIPIMDAGYSNPYGNDTFMENEDGSLTFCLKGVVEKPVISCDGATANLPLSITLPMHAADGTFTIRDSSKTANNELDVIVEIFGSDIVEGQDFVTQLKTLVNPDYASLVSFTTLNPTVFAGDGTVTGYINIKANIPDLRISVELIKAIDVNPELLFLNILTLTNPATPTYFWDTHDPENGNYLLSACISDNNLISCAGATQSILFEPGPAFNGQINWAVEFDGVTYDIGNVWAGEIISNMPSHIKDMIFMEWTGSWLVENRDTQPHRFKLIPSPKPGYDPIQAPSSTNESFLLNEDGSFTFCLAGVEPVYPPYAVVKTNALWGSSFPAKITVNGTEYSGDLFGNLADILAHQYNIYTGFERIYGDFEGDPDLVRVVFAGDVFAENASISVEFLSEIAINIDDSFSYPENETLKINGKSASFNIGKLVCITKVAQYGSINNSNFLLEYGQPFNFRVGDKINTNILTNRIAGAGIEDPASFCASAASPEGCVQSNLLSNLSEQWNPELRTINVKVSWSGLSRVVMPLNASDDKGVGDPFATAKFVVQPNDKTPINDMYFLGYTIPTCDDMPS